MHKSVKLALTAMTAAFILASALSTASARNLEVSSQTFRVVWSNLEFTNEFGIGTVRCSVTLEGSFHSRTIPKVERLLIGAITRANVGTSTCTGGRATPSTEILPWHVTYENFTGTLPAIRTVGLLLSRIGFLLEASGCNGRYGEARDNISGSGTVEGGGGITTLAPVAGRNRARLVLTLSGICPAFGGFVGSGNVTVLNGAGRVTVRLI